jgi:hypothetical protein
MFRSTNIIGEITLSLAKVTFMKIGKSMWLWAMRWCGSILYQVHGGVCVLCAAQRDTFHLQCL